MFHQYASTPEPVPTNILPSTAQALRSAATPTDLSKYAAFFVDLDSYTEYWDIYRPELNGKYMKDVAVIFGGALRAWFTYAMKENTPEGPSSLAALKASIANPAATTALQSLDGLLLQLLLAHFPSAVGPALDADSYLAAVETFARDVLPPDPDRLSRTPPDDDRYAYAGRHRMDGASLWFSWAGVLDCAAMLEGDGGGMQPHRALQIGAAAFGSAMDFTFRGQSAPRGKTRPEYNPDEATAALLRAQVKTWVADGEVARAQARDLYRVFSS
jgi:hypothetical protein